MSLQIITIDGPSASGKGALGKIIADRLSSSYLDTGLLYRSVALFALQQKIDLNPSQWDESFLNLIRSNLRSVLLEKPQDLRSSKVGELASHIALHPHIRELLVEFQRTWAEKSTVWSVFDGRDCGSAVFPDASIKIYITARLEVRAQRRYTQLISLGEKVIFEEVLENLNKRDLRDSTRKNSPLIIPEGAYVFDNSDLSLEESVDALMKFIEFRIK